LFIRLDIISTTATHITLIITLHNSSLK